jgi:RND family efflux transporter MFP subunit
MVHSARLALLPILLVILLTAGCSSIGRVEGATSAASNVPTVAVARVSLENLAHDLVLTAEFKPFQEIDVMAKVNGYIRDIPVDVGDRVNQGQVLALLEIPEMDDDLRRAGAAVERSHAEVARADDELQRAQSAHDFAHLSFERLSGVSKKRPGLIAQQELDDAHSKDLVGEAQIAAAKSARAAADEQVRVNQADVQKVKTLMDYTRVTAPFAGVITKRYADTGAMQTQSTPVVRLSENNLLRLILPVPESAVPTVHIGQQVEVRVPSMHRSFPGRVARFTDKVASATRTMDTEVDVPNPSLVLIPGMYAEVDLTLERRDRVLAIPVTAVDLEGDTGRVMVITANNRVEERKIALGLATADKMEVRSGLNEGDQVVISGRSSLQPGDEVRPKLTEMAAEKQ